MPITKRILMRRSMYAAPELYRNVEKPEGKLQGIAQNSMVGMLVQLSYLTAYSYDIYGEIMTQANSNYHRLTELKRKLENTTRNLQNADSKVSSQNHFHNAGLEYKTPMPEYDSMFKKESRNQATADVYSKALKPPNLNLLTPYSETGKACLKSYTDPDWFYEEWVRAQEEARARMQRERDEKKKAKKEGKKDKDKDSTGGAKKDKKPKTLEKKQFAAHGPEIGGNVGSSSTRKSQTPQQSQMTLARQQSSLDQNMVDNNTNNNNNNNFSNIPPPPLPSSTSSSAFDSIPPPPSMSFAPPPGPPPDLIFDIPPPPISDMDFGLPPPPIADQFAPPPISAVAAPPRIPDVGSGSSSSFAYSSSPLSSAAAPPPPPMAPAAPAPPPPPTGAPTPMARYGGDGRGDLLTSIQAGPNLKTTEPVKRVAPADPRSQLLQSISSGKSLKSVADRPLTEKKVDESKPVSNVGQILARAFEIRQAVADSDSDDSSDNEWDD